MLLRTSQSWPRFTRAARLPAAGPQTYVGTGALSVLPALDGTGQRLALPVTRVFQHLAPVHGRFGRYLMNAVSPTAPTGSQIGTGALVASAVLVVTAGRGFNDYGSDALVVRAQVSGTNTTVNLSGTGALVASPTLTSSAGVGRHDLSAALVVQAVISGAGASQGQGPGTGSGVLQARPLLSGSGALRRAGTGALVAQATITSVTRVPIFGTGSLTAAPAIAGNGATSARWTRVVKPNSNWTRLTPVT